MLFYTFSTNNAISITICSRSNIVILRMTPRSEIRSPVEMNKIVHWMCVRLFSLSLTLHFARDSK